MGRTKPVKTEEQKEKAREYARQWRINNPEKCKKYHQVYVEKYPEKERERHKLKSAKARALHPERQALADKKWMENNRETHREKSHKRRVRMQNAEVLLVLPKELKRLYKQPCAYCGSKWKVTADHIIPIVRGGRHSVGNLQPLCLSCNASKGSKTIMEHKIIKEKVNV